MKVASQQNFQIYPDKKKKERKKLQSLLLTMPAMSRPTLRAKSNSHFPFFSHLRVVPCSCAMLTWLGDVLLMFSGNGSFLFQFEVLWCQI